MQAIGNGACPKQHSTMMVDDQSWIHLIRRVQDDQLFFKKTATKMLHNVLKLKFNWSQSCASLYHW